MDWRRASWTQGEPTNLRRRRGAASWWPWNKRGQASGRVRMSVIPDFKAATIVPFVHSEHRTRFEPSIRTASKVSQGCRRPACKHVVRKQPLRSECAKARSPLSATSPIGRLVNLQQWLIGTYSRSEQGRNSRFTSTNSSFGATVARHPQPHFRHSLVSEPAANATGYEQIRGTPRGTSEPQPIAAC